MHRYNIELNSTHVGGLWKFGASSSLIEPHIHDELEVNVMTQGQAIYVVSGQRFTVLPGQLLWLFPKQEHVIVEKSEQFEMWVLVFRSEFVKQYAVESEFSGLMTQNMDLPLVRSLPKHQFAGILDNIEHTAMLKTFAKALNDGLGFLIAQLWKATQSTTHTHALDRVHPCVEKAVHLLNRKDPPQDLPTLSTLCGMNPSGLGKLFKKQMGLSITDYRHRLMIDDFMRIYADGQRFNMLEAATEAGFGSYPQFHRTFRSIKGVGPRAFYRQKN